MFKNLKIGVRLGVVFAAVLILLAALAVIGVINQRWSIDDLVEDKIAKTKLLAKSVTSLPTWLEPSAICLSSRLTGPRKIWAKSRRGEKDRWVLRRAGQDAL
jgi:hypothetical protein